MGKKEFLFTSESVTEGHPDKVADQISDAILDAILTHDKNARVACETLVTTGLVFISGEITTSCYVEIPEVVRQTVKEIGYNSSDMGFDGKPVLLLPALTASLLILLWALIAKSQKRLAQGTGVRCLAMPAQRRKSLCPCLFIMPTG